MTVDFGIYVPQVSLGFDALLARARRCEALGFTSFWLYDHLYTPGLPGADALEAWTAATALLALTSRLRVGQLVLNNNLRHPALLAKMATTLDVISGGRLDFGIGSGSYALEHEEGGFPFGSFAERSERLGEALEIITGMFAAERTTFAGRHFQVRDLPNLPRPVQSPRPPIHIGGIGERYTMPLVGRYADVWNVPTYGIAASAQRVAVLDAAAEAAGRDPATIRRSLEAVLVIAGDDAALGAATARAERRYPGPSWGLHEGGLVGTPPQIVDRVGELVEQGFTMFVLFPADRAEGDMIDLFAADVMAHFA